MVEATEFKALEALEYPWRPFWALKRAHCLRCIEGNGYEVVQESMEIEPGKEVVDPSAQTAEYGILDRTSVYDVATMAPVSIAFTQINLQHCKSASAVLSRRVLKLQTSIALVQEPCLNKGHMSGLRACGQCFTANRQADVRACILVKSVRSDVWAKHCGRDLATAVIHFRSKKGIEKKVVVCSAYFPSDAKEAPPPQEVKDLIRECEAEGLDLVIGWDAFLASYGMG